MDGRANCRRIKRPGREKILNTVSKIERSKTPFPEIFLHKNRFGTVFAKERSAAPLYGGAGDSNNQKERKRRSKCAIG